MEIVIEEDSPNVRDHPDDEEELKQQVIVKSSKKEVKRLNIQKF